MQINEILIFIITITASFTISGLIGFGGNVLALPILSIFFDVREIILVFSVISFFNSTFRFIHYRNHIIWKSYFKLCVLSITGTLVGITVFDYLPEQKLKLMLGVIIILIAIYNLTNKRNTLSCEKETEFHGKRIIYQILLFCGSIMNGAFVCGGPLTVIYCNHYFGYDRNVYLGMEWALVFSNAVILVAKNTINGAYYGNILSLGVFGIISICIAFVLSSLLSKKISDENLKKYINVVLIVSGMSTIIQEIEKII